MSSSSKTIKPLTVKGLFQAFIFSLGMLIQFSLVMILYVIAAMLLWLGIILCIRALGVDIYNNWLLMIFSFGIAGSIVAYVVYRGYARFKLLGATRVGKFIKHVDKVTTINIARISPKEFIFEYRLQPPPQNWKQLLGLELTPETFAVLKKINPDFIYSSSLELNHDAKNFEQAMKILNTMNFEEFYNRAPLLAEGLKMTVINQDNGESYSLVAEPYGPFTLLRQEMMYISVTDLPKIFSGKNYTIELTYKGLKGYDCTIWWK